MEGDEMRTPYELANDPSLKFPFRMAKDIMGFEFTALEIRVEREERIPPEDSDDQTNLRAIHILYYVAMSRTHITNKRWIEYGSKFLGKPAFYLYEQTQYDGKYLRALVPFSAVNQVTIITPNGACIVWTKDEIRGWESEILPACSS